jgi:putative oxidoreductase
MNLTYQIRKWDITYPLWFTIFRVMLGLCLAIRGIYFLNNVQSLQEVIENSSLNTLDLSLLLAMIITWIHILGGTLIILGLLTRIAVWAQLPILLGAIIFINKNGMALTHADLLFTLFILVLLVLFALEGGGKNSMDHYLKKHLL